MSQTITLNYGRKYRYSISAIIALILGICSGPVAAALAFLVVRSDIEDSGKWLAAFGVLVLGHVIPYAFALFTFIRLEKAEGLRGQFAAFIGIVATFLWAIILISVIGGGIYGASELQ